MTFGRAALFLSRRGITGTMFFVSYHHIVIGNGLAHLFQTVRHLLATLTLKQQTKLFSTLAKSSGATCFTDAAGDNFEGLVTQIMTKAIIDLFKMIRIHHGQAVLVSGGF